MNYLDNHNYGIVIGYSSTEPFSSEEIKSLTLENPFTSFIWGTTNDLPPTMDVFVLGLESRRTPFANQIANCNTTKGRLAECASKKLPVILWYRDSPDNFRIQNDATEYPTLRQALFAALKLPEHVGYTSSFDKNLPLMLGLN